MIEEYRRSLKMPEAEEVADLAFYRPLGFILVKAVYRTPVTPNQITLLSLVAGLISAVLFSKGSYPAPIWGAFWYAGANILDCADGQLARIQNSGTLLGRVIDGAADYISSIAIFIGIGLGLAATGKEAWTVVVFGGISSALHAMFFDHYQSEFISTVRAEKNFLDREIEQFTYEIGRLKDEQKDRIKTLLLGVYIRYLKIQKKSSTKRELQAFDPLQYRQENSLMIRLWSFMGPTTNRTLLIACALAGRIDAYLWIIITAGNIYLAVSYLIQLRIHRRLEKRAVPQITGGD